METKGEHKSFSYVEVSLLAHVLKGAQLLTEKPWALICGKQNSAMLLMYVKYQESNLLLFSRTKIQATHFLPSIWT